jgi:hypothetical protein
MDKLGKTPKAEHQPTPRKTRELHVNVRRGLIQTTGPSPKREEEEEWGETESTWYVGH